MLMPSPSGSQSQLNDVNALASCHHIFHLSLLKPDLLDYPAFSNSALILEINIDEEYKDKTKLG